MEYVRPNRSDANLNAEEAAKVEAATRDYFDGVAPKRHTKPQRSEYSSAYKDFVSDDQVNPEYVQLQHLNKEDTQKLVYSGSKVTEEFMETEYYKDLSGIDKQHHTTGTGFIKVDNSNGEGLFKLAPDSVAECHVSSHGNPATNEWIPATDDKVNFISGKPNRSE